MKLILVAMGFAMASSCLGSQDGDIERLAARFKKASSEIARRDMCITAMDSGLISVGMRIQDIDRLFGTELSKSIPKKRGDAETGFIDFAPQASSPSGTEQVAYVGWYLSVEFDGRGFVLTYYITNAHGK